MHRSISSANASSWEQSPKGLAEITAGRYLGQMNGNGALLIPVDSAKIDVALHQFENDDRWCIKDRFNGFRKFVDVRIRYILIRPAAILDFEAGTQAYYPPNL